MTEIVTIPLNKLDADPRNVRKTYTAESLESLAASILANGVIQNIIVRKAPKGRYLVIAGGRRRAAMLLLAERGEIAAYQGVSAIVKGAAEATEISLTENVMREQMHPADQFEAFKALADEGKPIKDIAARFGTTEIIVNRRLALARVSPVLFELFRAEDMTFEQLAAFTITDDHARQEEVWNGLPNWDRGAHAIKRRLAADEVPASDKRLTLIGGLEAYEAAGGPVRRDLFCDQGGGFASDSGLLEKLVADRLDVEAEIVRGEGWKWVECASQQPENIYQMARVYPQCIDLNDEDQGKLDELTDRYDAVAAQVEAEPDNEDAEAELTEIEKQMNLLQRTEEAYRAEDLAIAGAIVTIDYYGKLQIIRGVVRDEDRKKERSIAVGGTEPDVDGMKTGGISFTHSAVLVEDLTAQKTAALRVEMANNPDIALVTIVHALLLDLVYPGTYGQSRGMTALQITTTHQRLEGSIKRPDACRALEEWDRLAENHGDHLPGNPEDLWESLMDKSQQGVTTRKW